MILIQYLFVLFAFILDGIIIACFPVNYAMQSMYFVPCLGIIALILSVRKLSKVDGYILSVFTGIYYDFLFTNTFLTYTIAFSILCFVVNAWKKHMGDSILESVLICSSSIFVLQLTIYIMQVLLKQTHIGFAAWFMNRMFLTLLINSILAIVIFFVDRLRDDYVTLKEARIRKGEHISLYKSKRGGQ